MINTCDDGLVMFATWLSNELQGASAAATPRELAIMAERLRGVTVAALPPVEAVLSHLNSAVAAALDHETTDVEARLGLAVLAHAGAAAVSRLDGATPGTISAVLNGVAGQLARAAEVVRAAGATQSILSAPKSGAC